MAELAVHNRHLIGIYHRWLQVHGRSWAKLAEAVPTKTLTQIKNYYQNIKKKVRYATAHASATRPACPTRCMHDCLPRQHTRDAVIG